MCLRLIKTVDCTYGDVRLVGGGNELEGRVEICVSNKWGSICDDQWNERNANVICKQLGFISEGR